MEYQYVRPLKELSENSDHMFDEWIILSDPEVLNTNHENRCICCRTIKTGSLAINTYNGHTVYFGSSCRFHFEKRNVLKQEVQVIRKPKKSDGGHGEFKEIVDLNEYSKRVLASYIERHECKLCCIKAQKLVRCERCQIYNTFCADHACDCNGNKRLAETQAIQPVIQKPVDIILDLAEKIIAKKSRNNLSEVDIAELVVKKFNGTIRYGCDDSRHWWKYDGSMYWKRTDRPTIEGYVMRSLCDFFKATFPFKDIERLEKHIKDKKKKIVEECEGIYQDKGHWINKDVKKIKRETYSICVSV